MDSITTHDYLSDMLSYSRASPRTRRQAAVHQSNHMHRRSCSNYDDPWVGPLNPIITTSHFHSTPRVSLRFSALTIHQPNCKHRETTIVDREKSDSDNYGQTCLHRRGHRRVPGGRWPRRIATMGVQASIVHQKARTVQQGVGLMGCYVLSMPEIGRS